MKGISTDTGVKKHSLQKITFPSGEFLPDRAE